MESKNNLIVDIFKGIAIFAVIVFSFIFLIGLAIAFSIGSTECFGNVAIHGTPTNIQPEQIAIDYCLPIPNEELIISNTLGPDNASDAVPPILMKLDKHLNVAWAISLGREVDNSSSIPLNSLHLTEPYNGGTSIPIFNETYMEPGVIYLDSNYDFEYACLSIM